MTETTSQTPIPNTADDAVPEAQRPYVRGDGSTIPPSEDVVRAKHTTDSSYQNYLFGSSGSSEFPAWSDSAKGRAAIRLVSRGIVGAAFFTVGGRIANQQLKGYNASKAWDRSKPLQAVAKGIDLTLGRGIEKSVKFFAGFHYDPTKAAQIAKDAITFRESRYFSGSGLNHGRSYGADIVGFTFDFAMASVGDASTRNIIQAFDPNIKKAWLLNDKGEPAVKGEKSHIDWGKWAKSVAKTSWYVFSKNQGEDWAAAIPYAFQMKFQRQFLSNVFSKRMDGHQLVFDRSWNGGAYRVNNQGQIVGDYQLAGAIDLHARFVGYNWYTLMFREGYDTVGNAWHKWKDRGFAINPHLPEHFNPLTAAVDAVGQSARYATKSFIKANMYMNPAVIPFWMVRVPQSKWRSKHFIQDETRAELTTHQTRAEIHMDANQPSDPDKYRLNPNAWSNYEHFPTKTPMDKVEKYFSMALNPFGQFSHFMGGKAAKLSDKLHNKGLFPKMGGAGNRHEFMREYVDASLSYTPYMYAKQEFGLRVDESKGDGQLGEMDKAIYQTMDHIGGLHWNKLGADMKVLWKLGTNFERDIKVREGGEPGAQEVVKAPKTKPETTVQANSINHDPTNLSRGNAANDADHRKHEDAANDAQIDSRWTKMVANGDYSNRLHPGTATRH